MGGWVESVRRWRATAKRDSPGFTAKMSALGRVVDNEAPMRREPGGVGRPAN